MKKVKEMEAGAILIRPAVPEDAGALVEFNRAMARETEGKELSPEVVLEGVRHLIEQPAFGFYIVAESGGRPVGTLMITYEWSDWRDGLIWWIQSVYVDPPFRRRGVFRQLFEYIRRQANEDPQVRGLRLYVDRDNTAAQAVYQRLGLKPTGYLICELLT